MQALPHYYKVSSNAYAEGDVTLSSGDLPNIISAPPTQFGGPGDKWSPEDILVAAIADCFILSFRAVAKPEKLNWSDLSCSVVGTLDRVERATQFTAFTITATLTISADTDEDKARSLLEKAEHICLISNSLKARPHLETVIKVDA